MRIASWNVNSLRVRLPHVLAWLEAQRPDVLGLQETKVTDDAFPAEALAEAGYESLFAGQKTYNGVALLTREAFEIYERAIVENGVLAVHISNRHLELGPIVGRASWRARTRPWTTGVIASRWLGLNASAR